MGSIGFMQSDWKIVDMNGFPTPHHDKLLPV